MKIIKLVALCLLSAASLSALEVGMSEDATIRACNVEVGYDTSRVVIDSIVSQLGPDFMTYKAEYSDYWGKIHAVAVLRGPGSRLVSISLFKIYIHTKTTSGQAPFVFEKNRISLVSAANLAMTVDNTDYELSVSSLPAEMGQIGQETSFCKALPNPFSEAVAFASSNQKESLKVGIFDVNGRLVKRLEGKGLVWAAEGVRNGVYFARIDDGRIVRTEKLVLAR